MIYCSAAFKIFLNLSLDGRDGRDLGEVERTTTTCPLGWKYIFHNRNNLNISQSLQMDRGDKTDLNFELWEEESVNLKSKYCYTKVYEIETVSGYQLPLSVGYLIKHKQILLFARALVDLMAYLHIRNLRITTSFVIADETNKTQIPFQDLAESRNFNNKEPLRSARTSWYMGLKPKHAIKFFFLEEQEQEHNLYEHNKSGNLL